VIFDHTKGVATPLYRPTTQRQVFKLTDQGSSEQTFLLEDNDFIHVQPRRRLGNRRRLHHPPLPQAKKKWRSNASTTSGHDTSSLNRGPPSQRENGACQVHA
jgi:hypothetical protein